MIKEIINPQEKADITKNVLKDLEEWFGIDEATNEYIEGVKDKVFFAAFDEGKAIGFYCLRHENIDVLDLYVLGIKKTHQGLGIGQLLQSTIETYARDMKYQYLMVLTLAEKVKNNAYLKTRYFYLKMGFIDLYQNDQIFDKDNPCQIMIKKL